VTFTPKEPKEVTLLLFLSYQADISNLKLHFQIVNGEKQETARTEKTAAVRDPRTAAAATVIARGSRFFPNLI
jgi:hypothetical protein